jgi:hypothetical protein
VQVVRLEQVGAAGGIGAAKAAKTTRYRHRGVGADDGLALVEPVATVEPVEAVGGRGR